MDEESYAVTVRTSASNPWLLDTIEDAKRYYAERGYTLCTQGEFDYKTVDDDPNFKGTIVDVTLLFKRLKAVD